MVESHSIQPIGFFHGARRYPYEAPRQGRYAPPGDEGLGEVRLLPGRNFEQALADLHEFDRIWLLFGFHNTPPTDTTGPWKPLVSPPRHADRKIGVFATRAPHRPNGLGLSCVALREVRGLRLVVAGADLLNGSPVYDIKPYLAAYDSHPQASPGWTAARTDDPPYEIRFDTRARAALVFLQEAQGPDLEAFVRLQLEYDPTDGRRKRVRPAKGAGEADESGPADHVLAYRTWRIYFRTRPAERLVEVTRIESGYSDRERAAAADPYGDLGLHREFVARFGA